METKNNNNFSSLEQSRSVSPSLYEILKSVRLQVEVDSFDYRRQQIANEICLNITEVLKLRPENEIKIDGAMLSVGMVQEVFSLLRNEHIQLVIEKYSKIRYKVNNKKAYLRTALYNSVFELESHYENEFNCETEAMLR